ncbi:hypothetical protein C8F04DRAFT_1191458 [Mycena alexandri]|uniref:Uncharacterized protein n=1 Tax=Mycena alexandri TaxID=1745969 RepID=A0AAD6WW20_9AGAR|nr:hypothetical protein C8F04DRAFT_1191458 [Mycena alexandri]
MGKDDNRTKAGKQSNTAMDIDALSGDGDAKNGLCRDHMAVQPGGMHGGGRVRDEATLEARMMSGEWRIHNHSGAPVCASALNALREKEEGEEDELEAECTICKLYCRHVARELLQEDKGLEAALGLHDLRAASGAMSSDIALLQGELLGAQRENNKMTERFDTIQRELIEVSAKNAVLEKDKERIARDRDKADDDYLKIRKYADECRREADELERQLAHLDSGRHRKKIIPQHSGSGMNYRQPGSPRVSQTDASSSPASTATQGTDEDVTMQDASVAGNQLTMTWGNLAGIPKYTVEYPVGDVGQLPPALIQDFAYDDRASWKFADVAAWTAALLYSLQQRCWPVAILVFRVYYDARMAQKNGKPLSVLHRHALENYAVADWLLSTWKEWALDTDAQNKNRSFWAMAHRPRGGTMRELVAYIQKQGREVEGCPFVDNYHTIRSRDARGLLLWMSINYVPATKDAAERDKSIRVSMALLRMLAVPNAYEDAVLAHALTIADAPEYESWPGHITENLDEVAVADHLAGLGVTIAVANDAWAYALNYLDALIATPRAGWDQPELAQLRSFITVQMEDVGLPVGMANEVDYIPRTPGLPWPDTELNRVQEDGLFLEDLPTVPPPGSTERGKVTCVRMGSPKKKYAAPDASGGSFGNKQRPIAGRGRGGFRGRGNYGGYDRGEYRGEPRNEKTRSMAASMYAPRPGSSNHHASNSTHGPSPHPSSSNQQTFHAGNQHAPSPAAMPMGQPPRSLHYTQQQQHTPAMSNAQPPPQWITAGAAAPLTFGAIAPQSVPQPPPSSAPSHISFEGRTYHLGHASSSSNSPAPQPQSPAVFQPHHFIPNNLVGPAPGAHNQYPYATVSPSSVNAGNTGLVGTPMTDLYHALPASSDLGAGFDMHTYNTSGTF